jgi:hypothetical protein
MGPCTRVYAVECVWASVVVPYQCQVMSAPIPEAVMLAMLIRRMEALEWDGSTPRSLLGWGKRGNGWVTLGISCLGGWPLLFNLEWWGLYTVWCVLLPNYLPLEGVDRIHIHMP